MSGPGPLDLVALSLAGARLVWLSEPQGLVTAEGYAIATTGDNPCYHIAYKPGDRCPTNELGAGAGSLGLAKCKTFCERHFERSKQPQSAAHAAAPVSTKTAPPVSNNQAAPTSNNVSISTAQPSLF